MELSTRARRRLSTILALVLAAESVSAVSVAATSVGTPVPAARPSVAREIAAPIAPPILTRLTLLAEAGAGSAPRFAPRIVELPERPSADALAPINGGTATTKSDMPAAPKGNRELRATLPQAVRAASRAHASASSSHPATAAKPASKPAPKPASKPALKPAPKPVAKPRYAGTNHVWIPSLGISRPVYWYPCDRSRAPDNFMYRWGCAGANNVYLLGHAWGVMKPLHDAYVSGRLRVGMKTYYAGADAKVHEYSVRWWKLTLPTTAASWAWAAQSVPSMTLQTCVGAQSQWRLMVRLVEVNG
jgi:hypothetical protein